MHSGPVILDNTPLVAFWALGRIDLLRHLYGEVLIPDAVQREFLATESASRRQILLGAPWIHVAAPHNPQMSRLFTGLGAGEAGVLALAVERSARLVIIDERRARRYTQRLNIPTTGTLGVLLAAKQKGFIDALNPSVADLLYAGFYFKAELIDQILKLAGE